MATHSSIWVRPQQCDYPPITLFSLAAGIDERHQREMSTAAKSHGLDGTLVEPDWQPLALDEVRRLLHQIPGCGEPIEILSVSPRPLSAASVVAVKNGRVFVKRHHRSVRDCEGLMEEHRFIAHLRASGAAVPKVLAAKTGETAFEDGEWTYEVHETPAGVDSYRDAISWTPFRSVVHAHSAGQMLARLHRAALGFLAPRRKPRPLVASFTIFAADDPSAAMESYMGARPALASDATTRRDSSFALDLLAPFHAELLPLLSSLEPLWTHNDLHASNLFWSSVSNDSHATSIFDFGLADRTNAVHDLAHAIERNIVEWLALPEDVTQGGTVAIHLDHLNALLDGYEEISPLSAEEEAALAPMTALCHAEFALTEADYFLGVLHSDDRARVATERYLVGHARWFRSASGQKLLDALRKRANSRDRRKQEAWS
jgi:Ser/Thr protein kinase RdoA (MazF antagonist)